MRNYGLVGALWALTVIAAGVIGFGRHQRGRRRRFLSRSASVALVILVPTAAIETAVALKASFSDTTALLGIVLTVFFALAGSRVSDNGQQIKVAIVIPSRVPFFTEIRRGIREELTGIPVKFYDDYDSSTKPLEDLSDFMPCLRRAIIERPDYLLLACPSPTAASSDETLDILRDHASRGGASYFIENGPSPSALTDAGKLSATTITADSRAGAQALAKYLSCEYADYNLHMLSGPESSHPAQIRRDVFAEHFPEGDIRVADMAGWTRSAARDAAQRILEQDGEPLLLVCGNDSMALGAIDAVRLSGRMDVAVVGYDGVRQMLAAISEPSNPAVATLRTPPAAYGQEAGARIRDHLALRRKFRPPHNAEVMITVDEAHLVTPHNVESLLADLWN